MSARTLTDPVVTDDVLAALSVTEAWTAVMTEVQAIRKDSRNSDQNFNFRGIDAVLNTVGPVLRKHGVIVLPIDVFDIQRSEYTASNGRTRMVSTTLRVRFQIIGPDGGSLEAVTAGEAADSSDKGMTKAISVATRTLFLIGLTIPTDEVDPDQHTVERYAGPSKEQQAGRIANALAALRETATITDRVQRVQQVKRWQALADTEGILDESTTVQGRLVTLRRLSEDTADGAYTPVSTESVDTAKSAETPDA